MADEKTYQWRTLTKDLFCRESAGLIHRNETEAREWMEDLQQYDSGAEIQLQRREVGSWEDVS